MSFYKTFDSEYKQLRGVVVVRIDITGIDTAHLEQFLSDASKNLIDENLKQMGFTYYFLPVRNENTSMTFIDLETMNSVKA